MHLRRQGFAQQYLLGQSCDQGLIWSWVGNEVAGAPDQIPVSTRSQFMVSIDRSVPSAFSYLFLPCCACPFGFTWLPRSTFVFATVTYLLLVEIARRRLMPAPAAVSVPATLGNSMSG